MRAFYFGCWGQSGHFLHTPDGRHVYDAHTTNGIPFNAECIDGIYLPKNINGVREPEGIAYLVRFKRWTLLAFWDRSVDTRYACNSNFILEGEWTFEEALQKAKDAFPSIFARFKFPIVEGP